jgi:hypothetical protein
MANKIRLKKSSVPDKVPAAGDLEYGELAINYADGKLYYKNSSNVVASFGDSTNTTEIITEIINEEANSEVDNVLYVAKNGLDTNNGKSLAKPFLSIKAALAVATANTTIFVKSGDYTEDNPVTIPTKVAIVGDNLRTVSIRPLNPTSDIFYVNNGSYVTGVTFRDHLSPSAAIAYNPNGSAGFITTSPYVQNCSSITTTGCGMRIDGSYVSGLRSMVVDSYTQINQGGIGIHIINRGYAQLVSVFTICTSYGIKCESGGQCSVTNSNSSFGDYGLSADGVSAALASGFSNGASQIGTTIVIDGLSTYQPAVNDVVQFVGDPEYYAIFAATATSGGQSSLTLEKEVTSPIADNTGATFFQRSLITSSGHTFEYVGSGTNLLTALPQAGGVPIQVNEIEQSNGGRVFYTSTDHFGDFRVGDNLVFNRAIGTITGRTFDRSLFAVLTPYILALEG